MLEIGERVEGDDGYRGEAPERVKCPTSIGNHAVADAMAAIVRRRGETINKRFKQWNVLKVPFRGNLEHHGQFFRFAAMVTQIAIEHGEPLFSVDYEDPDFDNGYYERAEDDDDDDDDSVSI